MKYKDIKNLYNEENDPDEEHRKELDKTGFWGKKGAGCFCYNLESEKFLFLKRSRIVEQPLTWNLAGGAIDPDEDPQVAALRELNEETGIKVGGENSHFIHVFKDNNSSFSFYNFLTVIDNEIDPILNWENESFLWETIDNHPTPLHFGLEEILSNREALIKIKKVIDKYSK